MNRPCQNYIKKQSSVLERHLRASSLGHIGCVLALVSGCVCVFVNVCARTKWILFFESAQREQCCTAKLPLLLNTQVTSQKYHIVLCCFVVGRR